MKNLLQIVCFIFSAALFVFGSGCSSSSTSSEPGRVGKLGTQGRPDDNENEEEKIAIEALPAAVVAAVNDAVEGGVIVEAERETEDGRVIYEIEVDLNGVEWEVEVDEDGNVLEVESEDEDDDDDDEDDEDED